MKKTQLLDARRNVRRELVAFVSIVIIGMLASLSYLAVTYSAATLKKDALGFFNSYGLWDLEIASTALLDDGDLEAIRALPSVETAERVWQIDGKLRLDSGEKAVTIISLPDEISRPKLLEGRLPEKAGECAVEKELLDSCALSIGQSVSPETKAIAGVEALLDENLVITGVFQTPDHITYMIPVTPYILVMEESFNREGLDGAFMKIRVRVEGTPEQRYGDAYWEKIAPVEEAINAMADERAALRAETMRADVDERIDEGRQKLSDARTKLEDGRRQYEEGRAELESKRAELEEGRAKLEDGRRQYEEGRAELESKRAELEEGRAQLEEGRRQYEEGRAELESKHAELEEGRAQLEDGRRQIEEGRAELESKRAQLEDARAQLEEGRRQYEEGLAELTSRRAELEDARAQLEDGRRQIEEGRAELTSKREELENGRAQLEDGRTQLEEGRRQLSEARAQLDEGWKAAREAETKLSDAKAQLDWGGSALAEVEYQLSAVPGYLAGALSKLGEVERTTGPFLSSELRGAVQAYKDGMNAYGQGRMLWYFKGEEYMDAVTLYEKNLSQLKQGEAEYAKGQTALEENEQALLDGEAQLLEGEQALKDGERQLHDAEKELKDGEAQLLEGEQALKDGEQQLRDAEAELKDGEARLLEGEQALSDGERQLRDAEAELKDGEAQLLEGEKALKDGEQQLRDAEAELKDGEAKLLEGEQALKDGEQQLRDAEAELKDGEAKLLEGEQALQDGEQQLLDAEAELKDGEAQLRDGERELLDAEAARDGIAQGRWVVLNDKGNPGFIYARENANKLASLSMSFSSIFLVVGAMVIYATISRMVEQHRRLIGATKAMGLYKREVFGKYLFFACTATMLGVGAGTLLAWGSLQRVILSSYEKMLCYGEGTRSFLPMETGLVVAGAFAISVLAVYLGCAQLLRQPAIALMQGAVPAGNRKKTGRSAERNLYFRLIFRNMRTDWSRVLVTIVSVAGGCMLMVIGFTLQHGISGVPDRQFGGIMTYEAEIFFDESVNADAASGIEAALEEKGLPHVGVRKADGVFEVDDTLNALTLITAEKGALEGYFALRSLDGDKLEPADSGVLVPRRFWEHYSFDVGDRVPVYDSAMNSSSLLIAGVFENYYGQIFFLSPESFEEIFQRAPTTNCYFVKTGGLSLEALREELSGIAGVQKVNDARAERHMIEQFTAALNYVVLLMLFIAAMMACFIVANFTVTFIQRKTMELTIMRINGFSVQECVRYVALDLAVTTVLGIALGLVLGGYLGHAILKTTETPYIQMIRESAVQSYLYSALITGGFSAVTNSVALRRIRKLKLSDIA